MWLIPVTWFGLALILLVGSIAALTINGWGISQGVYLESRQGQAMLIRDNAPIVMSGKSGQIILGELGTGDSIIVVHDGIAESYPAQTAAYLVVKTKDGDASNVPGNITEQLIELGWIDPLE